MCVCVCIIPKSSEKHVAGMFPKFNSCNLWMPVIEQLFIYIYMLISRLPLHLAVISLCIGKHECMVIVFNIYRSVKELSGGTCPCLFVRNRDRS